MSYFQSEHVEEQLDNFTKELTKFLDSELKNQLIAEKFPIQKQLDSKFDRKSIEEYRQICKNNYRLHELKTAGLSIEISFPEMIFWIGKQPIEIWISKTPKTQYKFFWQANTKNKPFTTEIIYQSWGSEFDEKSFINPPKPKKTKL